MVKPGQRLARKLGFFQVVYFIFNVVRIPDNTSFEEKLAPLVSVVKKGHTVLIFPEGKSVREDHVQPFKRGIAELYRQTRVPVVPCTVHYKKGWALPRAVVTFGAPLHVPNIILEKGDLEEIAEYLRRVVDDQYQKSTMSDIITRYDTR
ncbi:MAG: lysophospholipid acyltransferase family protein [Candidatus Paceibacterota bacterium]